ncbi:hypothetical protein DM860_014184 [Cuscuta australis]|uniref:Protein kinase domain-containing protein n=1 Tax=Cuscuta australis TaxID=267555 RepID=A0A328DI41_9ASTE|nr:hypothetical protein DM860_014184 [Cuscuta australis]
MSCFFPCFRNKEEEEDVGKEQLLVAQPPPLLGSSSPQATPTTFPNKECSPTTPPPEIIPPSPVAPSNKTFVSKGGTEESGNPNAKTFTFRELASATKNFRQEYLTDEGGFGKVFKGTLQNEKARPIFRDPKRFPEMADPLLKKAFPMTSLNQAVGVAAMCLQEEASVRPLFGDVVAALSFLGVASTDEPPVPTAQLKDTVGPPPDDPERDASDSNSANQSSDSSSSSSSDHSDNEDEGEDTELQRAKSPRITNTRSSSIRSNTSSSSSDDDDNDKNDYFISRRTSNSEKSSHETDSIDFRNDRISYTDEAGGDLSSNEDLSSRLMVDFDKAPQESDSINLRTDRISDPDEDGGDLSFCYSVSASENLRSNSSIRESADEEDPMKESIMKPENRSFGSYSMSSDEGSDEEERSRR